MILSCTATYTNATTRVHYDVHAAVIGDIGHVDSNRSGTQPSRVTSSLRQMLLCAAVLYRYRAIHYATYNWVEFIV